MTDAPMRIRPAHDADVPALVSLLKQLGYPLEPSVVRERLARLREGVRAEAFVAVEGGAIVGLATAHVVPVLNRENDVAWLTALVVDDRVRGKGIGRALVLAVEEWSLAQGCERLSVTTHEDREGARAFYPKIGLEPTGRRFGKSLS